MSQVHERHGGPGPTYVRCHECKARTYRQARRLGQWRHEYGCSLTGKDPREPIEPDSTP